MAIRVELAIQLPNTPGAMARVCQTLADERVNITGLTMESRGVLRIVVDNHVHATGVLRDNHYTVAERDVLYVQSPNDPGALARVCRLIASAGINLDYAYGAAVEGSPMAAIVVGVDDAQRASAAAGV